MASFTIKWREDFTTRGQTANHHHLLIPDIRSTFTRIIYVGVTPMFSLYEFTSILFQKTTERDNLQSDLAIEVCPLSWKYPK